MKPKLFLALAFAFALAPALRAQEKQPTFAVVTMPIYWHGAGQNEAGTDAVGMFTVGSYQKTRATLALRTDNFLVPNLGLAISTAGLQYARRAGGNWQWYLNAGIGAITAPSPAHFAGNFGGGLAYDIAGNKTFSWNAIQVETIVGRYSLASAAPTGPGGQVSAAISTGLKITF